MKRIAYLSLAVISLLAVSCKKEYTCSCVYKTTQTAYEDGEPVMEPQTSTTNDSNKIRVKKKDASVQCEGSNGMITQNVQSGTMTIKQTVDTQCTLK